MPKLKNLYARLHATTDSKSWNVEFDGVIVAVRSSNPKLSMDCYLKDRGIEGQVSFLDGATGRPKHTIHFWDGYEKAREAPYSPEEPLGTIGGGPPRTPNSRLAMRREDPRPARSGTTKRDALAKKANKLLRKYPDEAGKQLVQQLIESRKTTLRHKATTA